MNSLKAGTVIGILILPAAQLFTIAGKLDAQEIAGTTHEHLTGVACDDLAVGQKRPEFGCFNIATEAGLHFTEPEMFWRLRTFPDRAAAEARKSSAGIVVEEDGREWLSEFGPRDLVVKGGQPIAVVGPLKLPPAKSYTAVLSYAVMRPGDRSRVHTDPGLDGWYMIVGGQSLETPAGASRAEAGGTMTVPPNVPMVLSATGTVLKISALVDP